MKKLSDRSQLQETPSTLLISPFYHAKAKLKWYVLIISLSGCCAYLLERDSQMLLTVSLALFLITAWFLFKDLVIYIPTKYIFDVSANAVDQVRLFRRRKIMNLDEVVIFQSSEIGTWHYAMGQKRRQFVKSYIISENFASKTALQAQAIPYEREIVDRIRWLAEHAASIHKTSTDSINFTQ